MCSDTTLTYTVDFALVIRNAFYNATRSKAAVKGEWERVHMETKGIMQQVREHFGHGNSSTHVIALGDAPSTVDKVQRELRKKGPLVSDDTQLSPPGNSAESIGDFPDREIQVLTERNGKKSVVWHPKRPIRCPTCGTQVEH